MRCVNCGCKDLVQEESEYNSGIDFNKNMTKMQIKVSCDNCGSEMVEYWDIKYIKAKITKVNNYHKELI